MQDRSLAATIQRRYNRFALFYDLMEAPLERSVANWRGLTCSRAKGRVLELGVGTGKNLPYYPPSVTSLTGIDFSPRMLAQAQRRAARLGRQADLRLMDAQDLAFAADSFDTVISTCVFCTVPDPLRALQEARRVCRPGGSMIMLEHVRSSRPTVGRVMDWLDLIPATLVGTHINRNTLANVRTAGFLVTAVEPLWSDIFLLIVAHP